MISFNNREKKNRLYCKRYNEWNKIEKEAPQFIVSFTFFFFYHSPFFYVIISSQFLTIMKILALKINAKVQACHLFDKLKLDINLQTKFFKILFLHLQNQIFKVSERNYIFESGLGEK